MRAIRYPDKLIDELTQGKRMEKILREGVIRNEVMKRLAGMIAPVRRDVWSACPWNHGEHSLSCPSGVRPPTLRNFPRVHR